MPNDRETLPVTRSKDQARESYDRLSRFYDLISWSSEKKFVQAGLAMLDVREGERVLEIGFGTGEALASLAGSVGRSGRVCGTDISAGMLKVASARLEKAGLLRRVELETADAARLPYDEGSFDAVFTSFALDLFDTPEIGEVLAECFRVLADGGRICAVSMSNLGKHGLVVRAYLWGHHRLPKLVDCRPIYVRRSLENAGFDVLEDTLMPMWGIPVEIVLARKELSAA
jgi:ubiquinone/menaquinone biosynthesis C-methylase UbiE